MACSEELAILNSICQMLNVYGIIHVMARFSSHASFTLSLSQALLCWHGSDD